ncbi:hypothetical protein I203_103985 [Kwoniella mangroviensis CBS 8507]|uniref:uncharacterized protein n=1 Tax=Kwoniella mangroviensis CBS 8507 TaxID=1296122 RepID=UPI0030649170
MMAPSAFFPTLLTFHVFPFHAPITLYVLDAPFGRFASKTSNLNVNGNIAWAVAELVSPLTFATTLLVNPPPTLNYPARILAGLYFAHYAHRAIISPLLLSPKRSPLHVLVALAMGLFNLFNGYLIAMGLAFYPPQAEIDWKFWLKVGGWAIGFIGNVYHDEVLNDLRRAPSERLVISHLPGDDDPKSGRYKVPRGGLYKYVSFPNYLCEWLEWTCFALAATSSSTALLALPPLSTLRLQAGLRGSIVKLIAKIWWPPYLLHPTWMFVLAEITSMLPRALRGHGWYKEKFDQYPKERKAVIPGIL